MLLDLNVPAMTELSKEATVERVLVEAGARVERGTPLFEMHIDLSAVAAQNCTPVIDLRIVSNEAGWVRRINVARGDVATVGSSLAIVTSTPDEALDGPAARPLRVNVGVVPFRTRGS